jgi:hypothetical protein
LNNLTIQLNVSQIYDQNIGNSTNTSISISQFLNTSNSNIAVINDFLSKNLTKNSTTNSNNNPLINGLIDYVYYEPKNKSFMVNSSLIRTAPTISVNITSYLLSLNDDQLNSLMKVNLNFNVKQVIDKGGKWPTGLGNVIAIDSSFGANYFTNIVIQVVKSTLKE